MWLTSVHQPCTERRPTGQGWIWQAEEYSLQPEREARQLKEVHLTPLTSAEVQASDGKLTPLTKRVKYLSEGQRGETYPKILISEGYFRTKCFVPLSLCLYHYYRKSHFPGYLLDKPLRCVSFFQYINLQTHLFLHVLDVPPYKKLSILKMLSRKDTSSVSSVCEKNKAFGKWWHLGLGLCSVPRLS